MEDHLEMLCKKWSKYSKHHYSKHSEEYKDKALGKKGSSSLEKEKVNMFTAGENTMSSLTDSWLQEKQVHDSLAFTDHQHKIKIFHRQASKRRFLANFTETLNTDLDNCFTSATLSIDP